MLYLQINSTATPIILWMGGNPGTSSLIGAFGEIGPVYIDSELELHKREISWASTYNLLFIDAPAMTGKDLQHVKRMHVCKHICLMLN